MTDGKKLCVLTVHGIGFQQPPTGRWTRCTQ
jgi:hypothetical protein